MRYILLILVSVLLFADVEVRQPDSDIDADEWVTAPLWSKIDEGSSSPDGDSIICANNNNYTDECSIENPTNSGTYTNVQVTVYARKGASGGNTRGLDCDIRINAGLEGQKTFSADLSDTWAQLTQTWTGLSYSQSQMNTLQILFIGTGTTGGNPSNRRTIEIDYIEVTLTYTPGAATTHHQGFIAMEAP